MAEYLNAGDTVEGARCEIYTRKEVFKGMREDPISGESMIVYELDRNCSVEVTEVLELTAEEKKLRAELGVHGEIGDKLKADAITLYVNQKRKLSVTTKEGLTFTHGGRLISTKRRTEAEIKYPFQNLNTLLGYSHRSGDMKKIAEQ